MTKKDKKVKKKKEKKEMSTGKKAGIFMLVIVIVIALIGGACYFVLRDKAEDENTQVDLHEIEIEGYGITLNDNDTELYKEEFYKLKDNLESKSIDYDAYAESIAKMFIIDLYTIDNKTNKYDVGGLEFVLPDGRDNYSLNVEDTLYKYLEDNSKGTREQELPEVSTISVESKKEQKFTYTANDTSTEYDGYVVNVKWTYVENMGYDTEAEVIIANVDNKLYVFEKN